MMQNFNNIAFGFSSAETERAQDPGLLIDGYVDFRNSSEEALSGSKFLFLGYKGAGKSSIAERIELTLSDNYSDFVKLLSLSDFPFTPFSKIIRGDAEPETKYPTAWSWILLIYILDSFSQDESTRHPDPQSFQNAIKAFREMGLSPSLDLGTIVRTSAKNNFKIALPGKIAEYSISGSETRPASDIPDFVESLKSLISNVRCNGRHYLIIDGLDDILTSRNVQYKSLSSLIFEVNKLNIDFTRNNVPIKIVLLCRTDLYERIQGANKNKIRQDSAVELDWYHDPREPSNSLLIHISQLRTLRSLGSKSDLFSDFFPRKFENDDIKRKLLDMTRHTPRDFLRLLSHIQEFSKPGKLSSDKIKSGMREYSIKYFLPEIQDELSGYANPDEVSQIISALSRLRKRDFGLQELISVSKKLVKPLAEERVYDIANHLFNCSALGNIQHRQGGNTFYTFKYRNRHSSFNENENIMLHRGLWKALNLV